MLRRISACFRMHFLLLLLPFICFFDVRAREICPPREDVCHCQILPRKGTEEAIEVKLNCINVPPSFTFHKIFSGNNTIVKSLRIVNSQVTNFTQDMFEHEPLRDISISQTNITFLSRDAFKGTTLEYLSLIRCNLTDTSDKKYIENLRYISNLKSLYLSENNLKRVKRTWYEESGHSLTLSETLVSLSLVQNKISSIDDKAFHSLHQLEYLDLSQNEIRDVKRNLFPDDLDSLSLAYNKIETLPDDLFEGMHVLRFLRLEHNKIKYLKEEVFRDIFQNSKLKVLDLRGNPINCGCYLHWLLHVGKTPGRFYGECDDPESLRTKALARITEEDLRCAYSNASFRRISPKHKFWRKVQSSSKCTI